MRASDSDSDTGLFVQHTAQRTLEEGPVSGRLEPEIWADVTPLPLPYPSVFDRPVAPSRLDPVLLAAGRHSGVIATADGLTGETVGL